MKTTPSPFHSASTTALPGKSIAVCLLLLTFAAAAHAHSDQVATGGFVSGYLHPLTGFDHLLAMIAVGIWGATLGKPLVWALPVTFPLLMVVGGILGIAHVPIPYVEIGIAASVVVLGLAIAAAWKAPTAVALGIISVFGILHGHAHGTELPSAVSPAAYAAGFVVATGMLHLAGIAIGMLAVAPRGKQLLRGCGALIASAGVWILAGMPGAA
jgi:urease accessory protein